jgi:hypothetical protein
MAEADDGTEWRARRRAAAGLAGLAVGVSLAGAFLLPRLRADAPAARPLELPAAPREPVADHSCPDRPRRRL